MIIATKDGLNFREVTCPICNDLGHAMQTVPDAMNLTHSVVWCIRGHVSVKEPWENAKQLHQF
jgi:hypothetical protein